MKLRNNRLIIRLALTLACVAVVLTAVPAPVTVGQVAARRTQPSLRQRAAYYEPLIAEAAARRGVDPRLLWTLSLIHI